MPLKHKYMDTRCSWLRTCTTLTRCGVKLVLWTQTSILTQNNEVMQVLILWNMLSKRTVRILIYRINSLHAFSHNVLQFYHCRVKQYSQSTLCLSEQRCFCHSNIKFKLRNMCLILHIWQKQNVDIIFE